MKYLTYSIIFGVLFGFGCSNSKKSCSEFKEGKFIYLSKEENKFNKNQIAIRTRKEQIYIDSGKGDTLVYDIMWTSDCEYELIFKCSNHNREGFIKIGDTLSVTIEPIDDFIFNYVSKVKKNDFEREFIGTMKKIE